MWRSREIQTIDVSQLAQPWSGGLEYTTLHALATGCRHLVVVVERDAQPVGEAVARLDDLVRRHHAELTVVRRTSSHNTRVARIGRIAHHVMPAFRGA